MTTCALEPAGHDSARPAREVPASCPCGSGLLLSACCGPYLAGVSAPATAQALMRSRYTAYVMGDEEYLLDSWHPASRPSQLHLKDEGIQWEGLELLRCAQGLESDLSGEVEFIARFRQGGTLQGMRELSRFERVQGRWYYRDGHVQAVLSSPPRPGRNEPCHCGSGKKYKKCCGA
ncbi:YchJ family protein [Methyloterricola oryzae]|uniref:YchJ family protein n=1 Tax=Methyloterricola oryzae TaxID=1495050 RepID=UPI0009E6467B|nr:YchJ family metal-binding protein [Methyloterricola oryzae]